MTDVEMVGWHHRLKGHESEQALRVGGGQASEVIDISPVSLDSSLCFFQPSVFYALLCIYVK